jgi:hypothetical protein
MGLEIYGGIKPAAGRVVKDTIRDSVGCIALVQHGVLQEPYFREAFRRPLAVPIEREVPRQVVGKNALRRPHV